MRHWVQPSLSSLPKLHFKQFRHLQRLGVHRAHSAAPQPHPPQPPWDFNRCHQPHFCHSSAISGSSLCPTPSTEWGGSFLSVPLSCLFPGPRWESACFHSWQCPSAHFKPPLYTSCLFLFLCDYFFAQIFYHSGIQSLWCTCGKYFSPIPCIILCEQRMAS